MSRLSIRTWLVMALLIVLTLPLVAGALLSRLLPLWLEPDPRVRLMNEVSASHARWLDPAWQASTRTRLAALGLEVVLLDDAGRELFRSPDAAGEQSFSFVPGPDRWVQAMPNRIGVGYYAGEGSLPALSRPLLKRYLLENVPLAAGGAALLLTLASTAWFIGRAVLQPLEAMSRAARQIAGGELDFVLSDSRVREVAAVSEALSAMGEALRHSLERQAALEQQRRLFIAAAAHDLRTPLFALRGHLEGLEKGLADTPERAARYVAVCREKADALERLVADLFAYARMEYLDEVPHRGPVELGALLHRAAEGFYPLAESKGVGFRLSGPEEPCLVEADAHQLTRAVENLLDNACRHTPPGGTIHLTWEESAGQVRFTVRDEGPGIEPHDLPHLFTPLYRGESSRNRRTGGAGLGLAIARRILQGHGGELTAANGEPTGGLFSAVIPTQNGYAARTQEAPAPPAQGAGQQ